MDAKKLRPLGTGVLILPAGAEEKTPGGIIIPDNAKEKPAKGEVLAVGPGRVREDGTVQPVGVKPGEVVLYGKYAGTEVELDGVTLRVMSEDHVLAVIEEP